MSSESRQRVIDELYQAAIQLLPDFLTVIAALREGELAVARCHLTKIATTSVTPEEILKACITLEFGILRRQAQATVNARKLLALLDQTVG